MSTATATVTDIGKALEERISAIRESGYLSYEDEEVTRECARRYVDDEHRKYERAANRDVERSAKVRQEVTAQLRERVLGLVTEHITELESDWSPALLASSFVLNGIHVTLGDATLDQLTVRAQMLEGMAAGDLQTAAILRQAIRDIQARGVASLNELASSLAGLMR
jgi:hypothetical protein